MISQTQSGGLATRQCAAGTAPLPPEQVASLQQQLVGWTVQGQIISKTFTFTNFHQAMSFINAVAWISNQQDHHPDLSISYNKCVVAYTTHSAGGLSENDYICAAKVDALLTA